MSTGVFGGEWLRFTRRIDKIGIKLGEELRIISRGGGTEGMRSKGGGTGHEDDLLTVLLFCTP